MTRRVEWVDVFGAFVLMIIGAMDALQGVVAILSSWAVAIPRRSEGHAA